MKELSIEEKAKRYDEAIERARKFATDLPNGRNDRLYHVWDLESIFPELAESEDERIRKGLIEACKQSLIVGGFHKDKVIAWLEKQGEQSTTDKVEPKFKVGDVITPKDKGHEPWQITQVDISGKKYRFKDDYVIPFSQEDNYELVEQKPTNRIKLKFKVGDWIVSNLKKDIFLIKSTNCGYFTFEDTKGNIYSPCLSPTEDDYHLWTIQDAKNGDVLVCPKYAGDIIPNIFIFKNIERKDNDVFCHCSFLEKFRTEGYVANADPINTDFYPATKEQRDLLFQKMKEAGYEWDAEKKELKKIEQKPSVTEWSEEDEQYLLVCKNALRKYQVTDKWDSNIISQWLDNKLKSLRPQNTCKPSDGQIKACKEVYADILSAKGFDLGTINSELNRLEEKLKKHLEE